MTTANTRKRKELLAEAKKLLQEDNDSDNQYLKKIKSTLNQLVAIEEGELDYVESILQETGFNAETDVVTEYGDLTKYNQGGWIKKYIERTILVQIASEYMSLMGTSSAIYEKNGDYALGIFSSGWCRLMDTASRKLCKNKDNKIALESGKWLCHESCWTHTSLQAIKTKKPADQSCAGGINLYAVPIMIGDEVIGSINFGYGSPPKDEKTLKELSQSHGIAYDELRKLSDEHKEKPPLIVELAKKRLRYSANLIAQMVSNKRMQENLDREEERYRDVFEKTPIGMFKTSSDGRVLNLNPAMAKMLGFKHIEQALYFYKDLKHDLYVDKERREKFLELIKEHGEVKNFNYEGYNKNGQKLWLRMNARISEYVDKDNFVIEGFTNDVTQLVHSEHALRASELKFRSVLENVQLIALMLDINGNIIFANDFLLKLTGWKRAEVLGKSWFDYFLPKQVTEEIKVMFEETVTSKKLPYNHRNNIKTKAGKEVVVNWNNTIHYAENSDNELVVTSIGEDVTKQLEYEDQLKNLNAELSSQNEEFYVLNEELQESLIQIQKINQELEIAKDKAEESDRLKSAFLANMSHEIRTPLNSIMGFASLLPEEDSKDLSDKYTGIIIKSSEQLISIIDDIVLYSKLQTKLININPRENNVCDLLGDIVEAFNIPIYDKGVKLLVDEKSDCNVIAEFDYDKLRQLVSNLVSNSFKYTKEGFIKLRCIKLKNNFLLVVEDTGIGIPEDDQKTIFARFQRGSNVDKSVIRGTGLGLSIVKELIDLMHGSIEVESELNKYTRISLKLPLKQPS